MGLSYIVGFLLYGIAIILPNWHFQDAFVRWTPLTFGIYLIHPLINGVLTFGVPGPLANGYLKFAVVVILSFVAVWSLRKSWLRKFI